MRGLAFVGGALAGAVVIGVTVAMQPWLSAGTVPSVDETFTELGIAEEDPGAATGSCGYCRPLDDLRNAFVRRLQDAQHRVAALKDSLANREAAGQIGNALASSSDIPLSTLQDDLAAGERSLLAARAAIDRIDGWRKHCQDDPICRTSQKAAVISLSLQTRCSVMIEPVLAKIADVGALSKQVIAHGTECEGKVCPASDCETTRRLRQTLAKIAAALDGLAGPGAAPSASVDLNDVRRAAEIRDIAEKTSDEIRYTSRLFPMMFNDSAETSAADVLAMASSRLAGREAILSKATLAPPKSPADTELTWRLKLLRLDVAALHAWSALNITDLHRDPATVDLWGQLSDDLGAALLHAAKLDLALQRRAGASGDIPCPASGTAADAAASAKAALAALAVCTQRSGCEGEEPLATAPADAPSAVAMLSEGLAEAQALMPHLSVSESEAPRITFSRDSYAPGEAIEIGIDTSRSQCLAGSSGLLRISKVQASKLQPISALRLGGKAYIATPESPGHYKLTLASPAARGGIALAEAELMVTPPHAACEGFNGRWQTDFGVLNLTVRDHNATGTYRRQEDGALGILVGVVSGTVLRGKWLSPDGVGGLRLTLDQAMKSFSGTWSRSESEIAGAGTWSGQCAPMHGAGAPPLIQPY